MGKPKAKKRRTGARKKSFKKRQASNTSRYRGSRKHKKLKVRLKAIRVGEKILGYKAIKLHQQPQACDDGVQIMRAGGSDSSSWWTRTDVNSIKEYNSLMTKLDILDDDTRFLKLWSTKV